MRRAVLVVVLGFAGAASAARAQSIVAGPVATQVTAALGERITIPVAVNMTAAPGIDLGSYRARLAWNATLLRFVSAATGTFATPVVNADSAAAGVLWFAAAASQGLAGVPVLANVTLEVQSLATADTFRLTFAEMAAATTFQDLLPFLSVTTGSFCAGTVWGDLDQDGTIQAVDAQIALMHAVGMPVSDTTNGDVDADGAVGTRDALVILSDVVGLDVSAFRVGTLVSGICQTGAPVAVNVIPAVVTLATADTFRVTAQVRDSAGNLAPGVALAWSSSDPARASIDSLGVIRALADGAVTVSASVSPTLSGSGSVTVGPRHRWRVDPASAQGALAETGSDTYPFATIAQAVQHAAPGDTVAVATGRYSEPLRAAKSLVFVGDSGAGGMPVISTPNQPAAQLAGAGRYVLRRFRIEESQAGITMRGDTLEVQSVVLEALRGPALYAVGPAHATVRGVTVEGAAGLGVGIDSAGVVRVAQVSVTGIVAESDTAEAIGIGVRADSVYLDTVMVSGVAGAGVATSDAAHTRVRRARVEYVWDGIVAELGTTLEVLDSTVVRFVSLGVGIGADVDSLRVTGAVLEDIYGAGVAVGGQVFASYDQLRVEQTRIERAGEGVIAFYGGTSAVLRHLTVRDIREDGLFPNAGAVDVDTVLVEGIGGDGINTGGATQVFVAGSTIRDVAGLGIITSGGGGRTRIEGTAVRNARLGGIVVDSDTLELLADTVVDVGLEGVYHTNGALLILRDVLVRRTEHDNVYAYAVTQVDVTRSTFDTAGSGGTGIGLAVYYADSVRIDSSAVRGARNQAIYIFDSRRAVIRHDTVEHNFRFGSAQGGFQFSIGAVAVQYVDSALIRHNVIRDNLGNGISAYVTTFDEHVRIDSNTIRGAWAGVLADGVDSINGAIEVVDNDFTGRLDGNPTYQVRATSVGVVHVAGNTIDSISGYGVYHEYGDSLRVRGNSIVDVADVGLAPAVVLPNRVGAAVIDSNTIVCTGASTATGVHAYRTTTTATGNAVTGCARGLSAFTDAGPADTVVFSANRVSGGSLLVGGLVARGATVAIFADNMVTGGVLSEGAYAALGTRFVHVPSVTITGDSVQGGAGRGIVLQWVDTADVGGNDVAGLGSLYADTTSEAGIWLRNVFGPVLVHGNRVAGGADHGILLTDTARTVRLDTNLVVDHAGIGVMLRADPSSGLAAPDTVRGTLNGIRRNQMFGLWVGLSPALFPANDFEQNGFGVFNDAADTVDVRGSFWADTAGPRCVSLCAPTSLGDSVGGFGLGAGFVFQPVSTVGVGAPAGTPPGGVAFPRAAPMRPARARTVPRATVPGGAP